MSTLLAEVIRGLEACGYTARIKPGGGLWVEVTHQDWQGEWQIDFTTEQLATAMEGSRAVEGQGRKAASKRAGVDAVVARIDSGLHAYSPEDGPFLLDPVGRLVPTMPPKNEDWD
ncbi:hypothetical protein KV102_07705 [Mumia sp. zg.B53]|uniref:hypothetical protein n=1 Tax=Mumia sp. zg.B53 TaxID=2855449 RepID=UPI001C6EE115|nr:hypothetical protein [Mumia sp. zg.B53]MBW9214728.1 hypothetical protein [Mumia sp. zg.B53]